MANYNSNYEIAQEISRRIGVEPVPFESVYEISLAIYNELGGEPAEFDSVYEILLGILPLVEGGIASKVIDDSVITTNKTWSSSKINEEIQAVAGTANSDIEGKSTEDFHFVTELPQEAEEDEQVVIKGENADTLYEYVSSAWVEQTPDANKLYFDTENEALYSYVTADQQFAPVSMVNTIVVGSNLNTNAALKAIKTPGVYSVVQRLHSTTKGDYIKNWTLTVEGVDYDEYERTDSVYQRIQSNYTIQKRTWSSTRATNDGWSSFSTYYAGEIKDSTTSKYYTWSSNKLNTELTNKANKVDYTIGMALPSQGNIPVLDLTPLNSTTTEGVYSIVVKTDLLTGTEEFVGFGQIAVINAQEMGATLQAIKITYNAEATKTVEITRMSEDGVNWEEHNFTDAVIDDIQNPYASFPWSTYSASKIRELLAAKQGTLTAGTGISISGDTISCTVQPTPALEAGQNIEITDNKIAAKGYEYNQNLKSFTINPTSVLNMTSFLPPSVPGLSDVQLSGAANTTTYTYSGADAAAFDSMVDMLINAGIGVSIDGISYAFIVSADTTNHTITLDVTLNASSAISNSVIQAFVQVLPVTISGAANTTTYTVSDNSGQDILAAVKDFLSRGLQISVDGYPVTNVTSIDTTGSTITLSQTLSSEAISDANVLAFIWKMNIASGLGSFVEGSGATASGQVSHAEGDHTTASGENSHAEGGYGTTASGNSSHAEGLSTTANGEDSHAEGAYTITNNIAEHAEGLYNVSHTSSATTAQNAKTQHSIGVGKYNERKNAFEIMQNGDMYVLGVGGYQGTDTNVQDPSIKTLQAYIASLEARITALEGNSTVE